MTARRVHFVAIGGTGMGSLAGLLKARGLAVTGSVRSARRRPIVVPRATSRHRPSTCAWTWKARTRWPSAIGSSRTTRFSTCGSPRSTSRNAVRTSSSVAQ